MNNTTISWQIKYIHWHHTSMPIVYFDFMNQSTVAQRIDILVYEHAG